MQGFRSFHTAERRIEAIEAAHMMSKGQVKRLEGGDSARLAKFVASLFGVAQPFDLPLEMSQESGHGRKAVARPTRPVYEMTVAVVGV